MFITPEKQRALVWLTISLLAWIKTVVPFYLPCFMTDVKDKKVKHIDN